MFRFCCLMLCLDLNILRLAKRRVFDARPQQEITKNHAGRLQVRPAVKCGTVKSQSSAVCGTCIPIVCSGGRDYRIITHLSAHLPSEEDVTQKP